MAYEKSKRITYLFADMDGTLTRSKTRIGKEMQKALNELGIPLIIVSGATYTQMVIQVGNIGHWILAQNGNETYDPEGRNLWRHTMPNHVLKAAVGYAHMALSYLGIEDIGDCIQVRGAQVSLSLLGHNKPIEEKEKFDRLRKKRAKLLKDLPPPDNLKAVIGGTTCIDLFEPDRSKGDNIERFIKNFDLDPQKALYLGDALCKGGNDESVLGVIPVWKVRDPKHTLEIIKKLQHT